MQVKSIAECSKEEHSAIRLTFIKLPYVIKIFILSILSGRFTQVLPYNDEACFIEPQISHFANFISCENCYQNVIF